tara:strand:+ start:442 stop:609 length:168 start_codon:yes stop_codon:yes gene_type:complete
MSLGTLAAPVLALVGLLIGLWHPSMLTTALAVLCGYAAGVLAARYTVIITKEKIE